jgi:hypothetical protein
MTGLNAKREGPHVIITVTVGKKRVRLTVTPQYAAAFGAEVITAAGVRPGDKLLDFLDGLLNGGRDA